VSAIRTFAPAAIFLVFLAARAAGPPRGPIAGWVEDLASEDPAVWRLASDRLWKAGKAAEPALRAAQKHPDADVVLRAGLILSRLDWGIHPDTPVAIVRLIERYRDGDPAQRRNAAEELVKQGRSGYLVLRRLLLRDADDAIRRHVADYLNLQFRPLVRDLLAAGDVAGAEALLEATAEAGKVEAVRDLAALWVLSGRARAKARDLEGLAAGGDKKAALRCVYLHRANGDLAAARRLAEKAGDVDLLGGVLGEVEDFKALARLTPRILEGEPGRRATLCHHAGDREGFEAWMKQVSPTNRLSHAVALYFNNRPREAIDQDRKAGNLARVCQLLAMQGRRREALALSTEPNPRAPDQRLWLLLEQAGVSWRLGEREKARKLVESALEGVEKSSSRDYLLGAVVRLCSRTSQRETGIRDVGRVLDRAKPATAPRGLVEAIFPGNAEAASFWWDFLRREYPETTPSASLARLRLWFEQGKADKDFDALTSRAEPSGKLPPAERDRRRAALARACLAVGKAKKAEEVYRQAAKEANTAAAWSRLGDFYLDRREWKEAAAEYGRAVERDRTALLALYLRGVALVKAGRLKEGQALKERARLLCLADEAVRYTVAEGLARRGLADEAAAEQLMLVRTGAFWSVYGCNAASRLASRAVRQKRHLEAARYFRRVYLSLALGGGAFLDGTAYLRLPAWAHLHQAQGLLAAGKLDAALGEGKVFLEHLPEEVGLVIDLVLALDRARRKADADRLFDGVLARHQKACADAPKSADCHNRLAWLAVRCGRKLDLALRHAKTATALAPDAAGCLDTLAEIHFQRGDKAEAVRLMKEVIRLDPKRPYFAAQLRRIEAGERSAELPES
jgi:tetratricopeptide (TPR) repeat protein